MNPKKNPRRCRGLGLDSGLDLAISRFTNSLACGGWDGGPNSHDWTETLVLYMV